ncbi:HTH-type transcriptional regulator YofA [Alcanivorax sp. ALC70]|nr:HTH-type transcriptional regulator YofA [Alcanivorax sp. ALC70]
MLIRSLEIFRAVVDTGSFSAAAERLHTVQSNVTAHVKKLETELDARLLERRNPVVATPAGRQLLAYARRIVELHDDALSRFRPGGEPLGELRLGSMETTAAVHLPRLLTDFSRRWPQLGVHLHTGTTGELIEEVRGGRLDAAFVVAEDAGDDLALRPVFRERLVLVSGRPWRASPGGRTWRACRFWRSGPAAVTAPPSRCCWRISRWRRRASTNSAAWTPLSVAWARAWGWRCCRLPRWTSIAAATRCIPWTCPVTGGG